MKPVSILGAVIASGLLGFLMGLLVSWPDNRTRAWHDSGVSATPAHPETARTPPTPAGAPAQDRGHEEERTEAEARSSEGPRHVGAGTILDRIDWRRHLPVLIWKKELHRRGSVQPDPETMSAIAALMADLVPACHALGVDDVNAALREPVVHARILSAFAAENEELSPEARKALARDLLALVPASEEGLDPVARSKAALDMYRLTRERTPPQATRALDQLAEAVLFTGTEVRFRFLQGQSLDAAVALFLQAWENIRHTRVPENGAPEAVPILRQWLLDGRREVELLRAEYGESAYAALWGSQSPPATSVELRLRLRLAMARVQLRQEEALARRVFGREIPPSWRSRVLIVAAP